MEVCCDPSAKLKGISQIRNVKFEESGLGSGGRIKSALERKFQGKAEYSVHIPAFGPYWSYLCSFAPVKERRSKATEQDLPPTTTAAEVTSEGEESISKDRIFTCPEEGCVPTFLRYLSMWRHKRAVEHDTLLDKAAVGYAQKLEEQCQAHPQLIFLATPSMTNTLPQGWESFQESQIYR